MKAPISKKILKILSESSDKGSNTDAVIVNDESNGDVLRIGKKQYKLQRIASYSK